MPYWFPLAGSGQSKASRAASWDPARLDRPADRIGDGVPERCGLYAEFGSGGGVVEPGIPA
jgi:hypothetical protein